MFELLELIQAYYHYHHQLHTTEIVFATRTSLQLQLSPSISPSSPSQEDFVFANSVNFEQTAVISVSLLHYIAIIAIFSKKINNPSKEASKRTMIIAILYMKMG